MNRVFEQSVLHWEREIPQIRSGESDGKRYVMSESLQFHWPGRGSGGSMSATRPFGQPLVLLSRQESPSTSSSPRPMERFYRATNKKRWQRWNILQLEGGGKNLKRSSRVGKVTSCYLLSRQLFELERNEEETYWRLRVSREIVMLLG